LLTPVFSRNKIAYIDFNSLHFFDGAQWKTWDRIVVPGQIDQSTGWGTAGISPLGRVTMNFEGSIYEYSINKWHLVQEAHDGRERIQSDQPGLSGRSCPSSLTSTVLKDSTGISWAIANGQLYKAAFHACVPQFGAGLAHPFLQYVPLLK